MKMLYRIIACMLISLIGMIAMPFIVPGVYFLRIPSTQDINIETVHNMIQKEIPRGATRTQVSKWLSKKKVNYGFMDGSKYDLNDESSVVRSGIPIKNLGGFISAKIPNSSRGILTKWDIVILFFFDKQDKLLKYEVYEQSYGL